MNGFAKWLDTFVDEKGLDTNLYFEVKGVDSSWDVNLIPLECVIEAAKQADDQVQDVIKDKLVRIDFANGDVLHFFEYLAKAMAL